MEIGTVRQIDIDQEMRAAYLDYAMSVITARALPDVRDGLKPVQRRILYAMNELGLAHASPYKKSARIVGEVLGKYHPHGDAAVYETMVRMAQDFSMRYLLVDGQGNFGSVDGDPAAAMRYTEARLSPIAEEMLLDIDKNTVDFGDNFDGTLKEPTVLPARVPNLLLNGSAGIAVGMATNIPPHNLNEVADAIIAMLDRFQQAVNAGIAYEIAQERVHGRPVERARLLPLRKKLSQGLQEQVEQAYQAAVAALDKPPRAKEQKDEIEYDALRDVVDDAVDMPVEQLMALVQGPDFPTGGVIVGRKGITDAYSTGRGRLVIRAKAFIEDRGNDRSSIIVTEIPYQVNKASLVEKIADLIRDKRIEGVSELRDESDRHGMRIVMELRRDVQARQILNNLFKLTPMQTTFGVNLLCLVDGEPRVLNLKRLLQHYIDYRHSVITRRTQFELDRARARAHILEGLKIALDFLDEVIAIIRSSPDADVARDRLIKRFKLSEIQAQAILDMMLRRLAALERKKIEQELADIRKQIAYLEDLLAHPVKIYAVMRADLLDLKQKYGDDRRTRIRDEEAQEFTAEDLIADEDVVVALTTHEYVKRVPAEVFRAQPRRSTRAVTGVVSKEQDPAALLVTANTHDTIIFLSSVGKAYSVKCHELPQGDRSARGAPLGNFISSALQEERIVGAVAVREMKDASIALVTRAGQVKRVDLGDMAVVRSSGINVMAVESGDQVIWAGLARPKEDLLLASAEGKIIRFDLEADVRASGRGSGGVRGMRLDENDRLTAALMVGRPDAELMTVSAQGLAKRTPLSEYPQQGRGGGGVIGVAINEKTGPLAGAQIVTMDEDVMIVSALGQVVRRPVEEIERQARPKRGVTAIELDKVDRVVAVLRLGSDGKKGQAAGEEGSAALPDGKTKARAGKATTATGAAKAKVARSPKAEAGPPAPPDGHTRPSSRGKTKTAAEAAPGGKPARATKGKTTPAKAAPAKKEAVKEKASPPKEERMRDRGVVLKPSPARAPAGEEPAPAPPLVTEPSPPGKVASRRATPPASRQAIEPVSEPSPVGKVPHRRAGMTNTPPAAAAPAVDKPSPPGKAPSRRATPPAAATPKPLAPAAKPATAGRGQPTKAAKAEDPAQSKAAAKQAKAAAPTKPAAQQAAEAKPRTRKPGKDDIVIRTGGKATVVSRSELLPGEESAAPPAKPMEKARPATDEPAPRRKASQTQLPLWGEPPHPKKKK